MTDNGTRTDTTRRKAASGPETVFRKPCGHTRTTHNECPRRQKNWVLGLGFTLASIRIGVFDNIHMTVRHHPPHGILEPLTPVLAGVDGTIEMSVNRGQVQNSIVKRIPLFMGGLESLEISIYGCFEAGLHGGRLQLRNVVRSRCFVFGDRGSNIESDSNAFSFFLCGLVTARVQTQPG